jgi:hypothetical protein
MAAGDSRVISMQVELVVGVVGVAVLEEECGRHVEGGWSEWEVDSEWDRFRVPLPRWSASS